MLMQVRRDVTRLHDRILGNLPCAVVSPEVLASYLIQVRANSIAEFVLVLRRSRYSILQHEDNEEGAALNLMRSIYLDTKVRSLLALLVQRYKY